MFVEARLAAGTEVTASPGQAHYLCSVMRRDVGTIVRLFNGVDGEWRSRIASIRRDHAMLVAEEMIRPQAAEPDLWLAFALLKRDATDLVVQKATELGVSVILPVLTGRTQSGRVNEARLTAIAMEAAEQSERLTVPSIESSRRLAALLEGWPDGRRLFVAVERANCPFLAPTGERAALLVGPEGGFTEPELDAIRARPFSVPVSLGPRILRAETASIAGLAILQARG